MKTFVQLTYVRTNFFTGESERVDEMGSFACVRLDSRCNLQSMIQMAKEVLEKEKRFKSYLDGFRIFTCESLLGPESVLYEYAPDSSSKLN